MYLPVENDHKIGLRALLRHLGYSSPSITWEFNPTPLLGTYLKDYRHLGPQSLPVIMLSLFLLHRLFQKFYKGIGTNDGSKYPIDTLHGRGLLLRSFAAGGIANNNGKIAMIACQAGISFYTPVEMKAGKDDDLYIFSCQFNRQRGADKSSLQGTFTEF